MKKFIMGLLIGALLFSITPVTAAIEQYILYKVDYKVMVNGVEYQDVDLPILNYQGNTYAPMRSLLDFAGMTINWNAELQQAEVTSPVLINQTTYNDIKTIEKDNITYFNLRDYNIKFQAAAWCYDEVKNTIYLKRSTGDYTSEILIEVVNAEPDVLIYNGQTFLDIKYYVEDVSNIDGTIYIKTYTIEGIEYVRERDIPKDNCEIKFEEVDDGVVLNLFDVDGNMLLENVPYIVNQGLTYIEYQYYLNNILPLINS